MTNSSVVEASVEDFRKLARIVTVDAIIPHPNADALELAMIGGWQCCVKIRELKEGDLALYFGLPLHPDTFALMELEELKHYPANSTLSVNYYGADPSQPRRVVIALTHLSTNDDSELFSTPLSLDVIKH